MDCSVNNMSEEEAKGEESNMSYLLQTETDSSPKDCE